MLKNANVKNDQPRSKEVDVMITKRTYKGILYFHKIMKDERMTLNEMDWLANTLKAEVKKK